MALDFNVKLKVVDGQHAECGGAMVRPLAHVSWPKGPFVAPLNEWPQHWFYITEPRGATWAAAAEFNSGAPMRLTSWVEKSPNWSSSDELIALQTCVQSMVDKDIKIVDVIQVMLVRRILPAKAEVALCGSSNRRSTIP